MVLELVIQSTIICILSCVLMHSKAYVAISGNEIKMCLCCTCHGNGFRKVQQLLNCSTDKGAEAN